jgi:hypothetical protein
MRRRLLSLFVLSMFAMMVAGIPIAAPDQDHDTVHDDVGSPWQDSDETGLCDGECFCLRCPGCCFAHCALVAFQISADTNQTRQGFDPADTRSPLGVPRRIFRPPRA